VEITRRCGSDTLDDTSTTPCPKMPLSEAVNIYRSLSMGPIVESGPPIGNYPRRHRKGEENYLHTIK
jgi:hypothetical protein